MYSVKKKKLIMAGPLILFLIVVDVNEVVYPQENSKG